MDANYLFLVQLLVCAVFFIGIQYVSYLRTTWHYGFLDVPLKENCSSTYDSFTRHIDRKDIYSYDKYQIWRYIEKREESLFIKK